MNPLNFHWENQRAFLAVLRTGSLSGAARLLGIAQATARRRIEALENSVGVNLFIRSPSGLIPTEMARDLITHVETMSLAAEAFNRAASAEAVDSGGTVRITSSDLLGIEILPLLLQPVCRANPQLVFELSVSNRLEALTRQEADIAIRTQRPTESEVVTRRVGGLSVGLYATQEFLDRYGAPTDLESLSHLPLIGPDRNLADIQTLSEHGFPFEHQRFQLRTDNHMAQLSALRAGIGIGVCPRQVAERCALVRVLPGEVDFAVDVWIAVHRDLRRIPRIALVFDRLADALEAYLGGRALTPSVMPPENQSVPAREHSGFYVTEPTG
ncbi:LysR family transcriptional regulator [Pseudomonas sp. NPDC099000]|uniref:LysR family transcriptional regulator n=1 Tax=Pseudomonas sp. NPDC099000 TaxID=3364488 RepID=UPI00383AC04B